MNGWLKPVHGIVANPLAVHDGCIVLPAGYRPELDADALAAVTLDRRRLAARVVL